MGGQEQSGLNSSTFKLILIALILCLMGNLVQVCLAFFFEEEMPLGVVNVPGLGQFMVDDRDDIITNVVRGGQWWEAHIAKQMKAHLDVKKNAIDVGAHIGVHTVYLAKLLKGKKVYAFEPQWNIRRQLETNLLLNGADNARVFAFALGARNSRGFMGLSPKNNTGGTCILVSGETNACSQKQDGQRAIEIRTLDSLALKNIGLIKMDVEGHELKVLKGAKATILRDKPVIFLEMFPQNKSSVVAFLKKLNYQVKHLSHDDYMAIPPLKS